MVVEKFSKGVYHIVKEIFCVQIIVTRELLPEENLYLHCLTDNLKDKKLIKKLVDDCKRHKGRDIYNKYMNQLTKANTNTKGESAMFEEFMERMEQMEREKWKQRLCLIH